jgi:hypothetical protein
MKKIVLIFVLMLARQEISFADTYVNGYFKSDGIYIEPHYRTNPNSTNVDNYSTSGNSNPYTQSNGYRAQDYSLDANNYGSGKIIYTGPRGGHYYINDSGRKVYVPKR